MNPRPALVTDERLTGEIAVALAGSLHPRRTVLRLFDLLRPRVADWVALVLLDRRTGALAVHGGEDPSFTATLTQALTEDTGLGAVLRSGQTELLHVALQPDGDHALAEMIPHPELRRQAVGLRPADVLTLALTARGDTIGALVLLRGAGRGFAQEDIALAERIVRPAAMALDSARLYEERAHVAAVLQSGLRPPVLPEPTGVLLAARFRAAAQHLDIGGDFYDVHGSGEDWLVVLGDVCGKGVEAAVLTGRARQSVRTAVLFDRRPGAVLGALNNVLQDNEGDRFVTAVCVRCRRLPEGTVELTLASAGHPPPLVLRADGTVAELPVSGTVAGVLPDLTYPETTELLRPGDVLLMFTDGITEARNASGFFGAERLLDLLPHYTGAGPDVLCEAVEQAAVEFLGGRAHDDMALFAVGCPR
ncbi:hypothetical protein JOF53_008321 [Crossiella equi]|uniref:Phosphoserine phosphatase n=1 Tax=Crossiella equi TaxID=130796 RepID=A0ABS5ASA9_9PSEU|nr:GAF domain-containing SpoIIE family protein phosphatase [Crossiella equi]MBP2479449.1 hypothetical protein [Crossiella equi]